MDKKEALNLRIKKFRELQQQLSRSLAEGERRLQEIAGLEKKKADLVIGYEKQIKRLEKEIKELKKAKKEAEKQAQKATRDVQRAKKELARVLDRIKQEKAKYGELEANLRAKLSSLNKEIVKKQAERSQLEQEMRAVALAIEQGMAQFSELLTKVKKIIQGEEKKVSIIQEDIYQKMATVQFLDDLIKEKKSILGRIKNDEEEKKRIQQSIEQDKLKLKQLRREIMRSRPR